MRRTRLSIFALLLALPASSGVWAADLPHRYSAPNLDSGLVQIYDPVDGRYWAAWAYRSGTEYDIAISVRQADGLWSEPRFIGRANSRSEIQPAMALDPEGNLYLAFAIRETGQIMLSTLRPTQDTWSAPVPVVLEPGRHFTPVLRVVPGQLVIAYRTGPRVEITLLPLIGPMTMGMNDGPDGFPPGAADGSSDIGRGH